jgi:Lipoprotein LpqB beta-propeller domain/WD40-like Beta Propeller Repeat
MSDVRTILERGVGGATPPPDGYERMLRRRDRKRRNQRIAAAVVGVAVFVAAVWIVTSGLSFDRTQQPAIQPTPKPQGIFSEVGGWIAYGNDEGIWAVNPTRPGDPGDRTQLSDSPGEPLAWSSDGSKLLFSREVSDATRNPILDLFVLNADGTETRLTKDRDRITASISPDGSQVVYVAGFDGHMYTVDTEGGKPRFLLAGGGLDSPTFSPDGTQIAYFVGAGDWGNTLRVMNADGSGVRVVIDQEFGHVNDLAWSPDGSRLAFHGPYGGGIWTVGVDGSGLTKVSQLGAAPRWSPTGRQLAFESAGGIWVINLDGSGRRQVTLPGRRAPVWSPDGSRIAYLDEDSLYVADLDGTHLRSLGTLELPPSPKPPLVWIAPPLSASGEEQPTAPMGGSGAAPFIYAIAVLGAVGVLVIAWRARRRIAAR